ncbi:phosphatidylinositol-specific phospholipase C/glycerophosphodiester phosphodiesterase family protein [Streptomyces sp. F63]|uniref:phosphatidylinositol-specific phospholipase C/glycerophosphodiester phosphodiesterase family protein n=1 Tax=Streptomyces sp. F63 TaxID=2824887 RepID=UPI001B3730AA|nr:phosphatidylinositol-specific phospholipase C/glycerophosphodiester phosphodiesterase family protein [Streptomyces sp. F63]MBQ0985657.1 phosphatidylinositol-specific phospholipase C/glycerophosphodiester phosphodiesterase family protein [Streptomyces sp. F63]
MALARPARRTLVTSFAAALAGTAAAPAAARAATAAPAPAAVRPGPAPLRRAHAHNDYEHPRPLLDALDHRFTGVEADIWLTGGQLLVGHDAGDLTPGRTLERLYLEPLLRRVRAHRGTVYPGHRTPVQLLIDLKNTGEASYLALHRRLHRYRRMLSAAVDGRVRPGAVTAVISGDRAARGPMEAQRLRYAFYDGRLDDLGGASPASLIPLISSNWTHSFGWRGVGPMPAAERGRLHEIVATAHREHRRVRFWATPDTPGPGRDAVWSELLAAGADHVNTDDLAGLEAFLDRHDGQRR